MRRPDRARANVARCGGVAAMAGTSDRLSCSLLDFTKMMQRFTAAGVSFVSVTQNFSTADAMGRLTLNMLMSFAEFERSTISERTRDRIADSRRKGCLHGSRSAKRTGGPVAFGDSVKDKKLLVNEVEAQVVREAFTLFLQHRQRAMVARTLTERGLLPRGSSRPPKDGLRWTKDAIARVLRNPLYAGFMMYGDVFYQAAFQQPGRPVGAPPSGPRLRSCAARGRRPACRPPARRSEGGRSRWRSSARGCGTRSTGRPRACGLRPTPWSSGRRRGRRR